MKFEHNPAHLIGTCQCCGEEMVFNVPRLGANGGYVHKSNGKFDCNNKTSMTPPNESEIPIGPNSCPVCGGEYGEHDSECRLKPEPKKETANESALATAREITNEICQLIALPGINTPDKIESVVFLGITKHSAAQQQEIDDLKTHEQELRNCWTEERNDHIKAVERCNSVAARLSVLSELLYKAGVCDECGGEIHHHMDEPFVTCQGCGMSEVDTGKPPLIQELRHSLAKAQKANDYMANQLQLAGHGARERLALEARLAEMEKAWDWLEKNVIHYNDTWVIELKPKGHQSLLE